MVEATSPEADPSNPDGAYRFVAGIPVRSPEGLVVRAPVRDWNEKARLDALDKLRGHEVDPMNGLIMPVFKVPHTRRTRRPQGTTPQQQ